MNNQNLLFQKNISYYNMRFFRTNQKNDSKIVQKNWKKVRGGL
jgi:hypothetical protein